MANWTTISESEFPWEREALAFIRKGLPTSSPIQVWSNFEFMAEGGAIYEVDTLVVGPWGAFLVEIKSLPGVVSSQAGSWIWRDGSIVRRAIIRCPSLIASVRRSSRCWNGRWHSNGAR